MSPKPPKSHGLVDPGQVQNLADLHAAIAASPEVALAVEVDHRHGYKPRLSLVSLSAAAPGDTSSSPTLAALDFLAVTSPSGRQPFDAVLRAAAQRRVLVHGGEHTFAILRRQASLRVPQPIDTQEAALLLGLPRTGLKALLAERCGITLRPVRAGDWTRRPLPDDDLEAALDDVRHLPTLWRALEPEILAKDLMDELEVASRLVEDPHLPPLVRIENTPDPKRFRQIAGARNLTPDGLRVLEALVLWRDQKARELDLPPLTLLSNAQLVELASSPEQALVRIAQMRFHSQLVHTDRQSLRLAVVSAMHEPAGPGPGPHPSPSIASAHPPPLQPPLHNDARPAHRPWPRKGPPDAATRGRLARLKAFRQLESERRGVGLQAVLPALSLEHLAFFPETPLAEVPGLGRRRIERYATELSRLLSP